MSSSLLFPLLTKAKVCDCPTSTSVAVIVATCVPMAMFSNICVLPNVISVGASLASVTLTVTDLAYVFDPSLT